MKKTFCFCFILFSIFSQTRARAMSFCNLTRFNPKSGHKIFHNTSINLQLYRYIVYILKIQK